VPIARVLPLFAMTIFVSAWLLFQVQPMFAKMALPLLGGTPVVWNTALVFFQSALLLGYLYAHALSSRVPLPAQIAVHLALLAIAFVALPVAIGEVWRDPPDSMPIVWLIAVMAASVGLPFFALSANAPLLQSWFARTGHPAARDPYFLYAASNLGSMLALLAYPFVVEPNLVLADQSGAWTAGYGALTVLIAMCAFMVWRQREPSAATAAEPRGTIGWPDRARWIALAFVPSGLLVSATTLLATDVAAIPLMWIVPLALYLMSFVLVFARKPLLAGSWTRRAQAVLLCFAALTSMMGSFGTTFLVLALVLATLFATALVCHGELARRRPATGNLTEFYVWMSVGGILGSAFCALVAPLLFDRVVEYAALLVMAAFLRGTPFAIVTAPTRMFAVATLRVTAAPVVLGLAAGLPALAGAPAGVAHGATVVAAAAVLGFALISGRQAIRLGICLAVLAALGASFTTATGEKSWLHRERTYFATHQVLSLDHGRYVAIIHGNTIHGVQSTDPARRRDILGYFHADSGIGRVFRALDQTGRTPNTVAVLGMGAGALGCYRKPGQDWTFFEIDPAVIRIAKDTRWFHFMAECAPQARMVIGDGRLMIAREPAQRFDVIVVDAFSSDSIPVHLYTREAVQLYLQKLAPGGTLLLNVSNRYLDVEAAMAALVRDSGLAARILRSYPPEGAQHDRMRLGSIWIAMAPSEATLAPLTDALDRDEPSAWGRWRALAGRKSVHAWTDDYSNLIDLIR
jgi:hypothetical protein